MTKRDQLLRFLLSQKNDLEAPAIALAPAVADVLLALQSQPQCELARMSGSGSTCFAIFRSAADAIKAAAIERRERAIANLANGLPPGLPPQ